MRILLLADSNPGLFVSKFLFEQKENIVGLCIHEKKYQNNVEEIISSLNISDEKIFEISNMKDENTFNYINSLNVDLILSIYWRYIIPNRIIQLPKKGCINYHPAMLPYNRGKNPNVWPIIENTPAGVSIHYIDEGIDTGEIIAQKEVSVDPIDTGESLYFKLERAFQKLFIKTWPKIKSNNIKSINQVKEDGTFHLSKEFKTLSEIDLNKNYKAKDLINLLRAKTFANKPSAYYKKNGKKIYLRLSPSYE